MKYILPIVLLVVAIFLLTRLANKKPKPFKDILAPQLDIHLKQLPGSILLDVRTPKETSQGMIPGATEIDFYNTGFRKNVSKVEKGKPIIIYCRTGVRSVKAAYILDSLGYTDLYNLKGGYKAWLATQKK